MTSRREAFAALAHRNFRLLWMGQLVSFAGSMMQATAVLWHVSMLVPPERKAIALGLVGLARVVPLVGFSLFAGVIADALDRRRLMLVTQACMACSAGLLALLAFRGLTHVWPIYLLTATSFAAGSFDAPARQSLVPNLVPPERLANALSLNTWMMQMGAVAGPALAGPVIAIGGVAWAYAINAASFVAVIVALLLMRDVPLREAGTAAKVSLRSAGEGLRFVFTHPLIRSTMLLDFVATFFGSATALLPIFAQDVLHVGAHGYGLLAAAPAAGAVLAGAAMVRLSDRIERRGAVLLWAVAGYGAATVLFGLSRWFWVSLACLALTGVADTVSMVLRNIVRQGSTPDRLRGRMTSVNMLFFMGGPQLGELEAGAVASWIGAPLSVVTGGVACVLATAAAGWTSAMLRRHRRETP